MSLVYLVELSQAVALGGVWLALSRSPVCPPCPACPACPAVYCPERCAVDSGHYFGWLVLLISVALSLVSCGSKIVAWCWRWLSRGERVEERIAVQRRLRAN
eukprot:922921-Amphidinium_carterae.1